MVTPQTAGRRILATIAWSLFALCGIVLIRIGVERLAHDASFSRDPESDLWIREGSLWTSMGALTGLFVGIVAGVRSRRLLGWVLGPTLGMAVVGLDYDVGRWLAHCGLSIPVTLFFPTTGLLVGWILGSAHSSSRRRWAVFGSLGATDLVGRWSCAQYLEIAGRSGFTVPDPPWLLCIDWAIAAGPMAIAIVIAADRGTPGPRITSTADRSGRLVWLGLGLALGLAIVSLSGMERHQRARDVPVGGTRVEGLPTGSWREAMARDCGVLDRALERHGIRLQSQGSPPERDFGDFLTAYDPGRRLGYLFSPHPVGHMHTVQVGEVPGRDGTPVPVCILAESWVRDRSMVLWRTEYDGDGRRLGYDPSPREARFAERLTPDVRRYREVAIGRRRFRELARASELERIVASFAAAIARRDAGDQPVLRDDEPEPHLADLVRRWGDCTPSDRESWREVSALSTGAPSLVRVRMDADGIAQICVLTRRVDIPLTCRIADAGEPASAIVAPTEWFWIGDDGRIIGDSHEWPPDGQPFVVFEFSIVSPWVELMSKGISMFRIDLGPEAGAIVKRREEKH